MKTIKIILSALITVLTINANAQLKVGDNPAVINSSAMLEIETTNKGFLPPRVALTSITDQTTIPSPAIGLVVFNTATAGTAPNDVVANNLYVWDGTQWAKLYKQSSSSSLVGWTIGEERAFVGEAPATVFQAAGTVKTYMSNKVGGTANNNNNKFLSEAQGSTEGYLVINGLRLDFWGANNRPILYNTTNQVITYSIATISTGNSYSGGTKTIINPGAASYIVDGDNNLSLSDNGAGEYDTGYLVFPNGEWYSFTYYLIQIDGVVKGHFTARRLR
ncbi:hypothetical protein [Emticicia sp. SJ17W-69]|uniref:hypothetical protein n=1 Tax=Emticicia sp. SJ17W-69 TaxID=3421657 RepID=UPI003EBCA892